MSKRYWDNVLDFIFNSFDEKVEFNSDYHLYRYTGEVDYVNNSEGFAEQLFENSELKLPEEFGGWEGNIVSIDDLFEKMDQWLPKKYSRENVTLLSYTWGGSFVSFNLHRVDSRAIFTETLDGFTPTLGKIEPVNEKTDLTTLVLLQFLKEGVPAVDLNSLELNSEWVQPQHFLKELHSRLKNILKDKQSSLFEPTLKTLDEMFESMDSGFLEKNMKRDHFDQVQQLLKSSHSWFNNKQQVQNLDPEVLANAYTENLVEE